jgi:hypothetical protein
LAASNIGKRPLNLVNGESLTGDEIVLKGHLARIAAAVLALSLPSVTSGATLLVNGSNQLTGATGVNIGGSLYNVSFQECDIGSGGFSAGCTPFFTTQAGAGLAAQALLDQVLIDGAAGAFDTHPELTFGCSDLIQCIVAVPYNFTADTMAAFNDAPPATDSAGYAPFYWNSFAHGTTPLNGAVFASFTPSVPEPATWAMMLLGFGAIGASMRRRPRLATASVA